MNLCFGVFGKLVVVVVVVVVLVVVAVEAWELVVALEFVEAVRAVEDIPCFSFTGWNVHTPPSAGLKSPFLTWGKESATALAAEVSLASRIREEENTNPSPLGLLSIIKSPELTETRLASVLGVFSFMENLLDTLFTNIFTTLAILET